MNALQILKEKIGVCKSFATAFLKWTLIAVVTGAFGGIIGTVFHKCVEAATKFRGENPIIILALPLGGLIIVFLYKICGASHKLGTNNVIRAARAEESVPWFLAPLIFVSTVITHLFGGSAGREGAALQLGGSIGSLTAKIFRLDKADSSVVVICGMSGVFSAVFGTPVTAAFFSLEVLSVGIMQYSAIIPSIFSAVVAYGASLLLGASPAYYGLKLVPSFGFANALKVIGLGVIIALGSILFCVVMERVRGLYSKYLKNLYVRAFAGGIIIIFLTFAVGSYDYNGAGMNIVLNALNGQARTEAFLLKLLFTALTIGAGYKGGEIVPAFFVGSTLGCVAGSLFGLDSGFCAALGMVGLFCGVVNAPVTSLILSVELFGDSGFVYFSLMVGVCYMLSGNFSLYSSQKIVCSKLKSDTYEK